MTITVNNPRIGWHNFVLHGAVAASSEQALYPASHLANPVTYLKWKAADNDTQQIVVETVDIELVNYFGVYGHNWGSRGLTVEFEYSADGGSNWTPALAPTIPNDDRVLFRQFTSVAGNLFRFILTPSDDDVYAEPPEATVIHVGRVLELERRLYVGHAPLTLNRVQQVTTGRSEAGQFLGRTLIQTFYETSVELRNLSPDWYRENMDFFARVAATQPFFWSWRPGDYPEEAGYAWCQGNLRPVNEQANGMMSVSFGMQGVN